MTRINTDYPKADSDYLVWLKKTGRIKNYSDVIKPAVTKYLAELKTLEGFQPDNKKNTKSK